MLGHRYLFLVIVNPDYLSTGRHEHQHIVQKSIATAYIHNAGITGYQVIEHLVRMFHMHFHPHIPLQYWPFINIILEQQVCEIGIISCTGFRLQFSKLLFKPFAYLLSPLAIVGSPSGIRTEHRRINRESDKSWTEKEHVTFG